MASAFAANRDIKIEASETSEGLFTLRTKGLADKRRPELEIAGIPQVALNGAGGVINMIADYSVNKAEVFADQTVGNVLAVGDEGRKMILVVRAVEVEKPKGGLWSKIAGGSKGVLRLADVTGTSDAPLTAVATMLVHRAAVRLAKDDDEGARTELEAAIATLPGTPGAGRAPTIDGAGGALNWQNHLAYLDLAKLSASDADEAAAYFADALARSEELARDELDATYEAVAALRTDEVAREAKRIVEHNLANARRAPGPTAELMTIASPIWELDADDRAVRRASLLPAKLASLYYDGPAAERLLTDGATLVTAIFDGDAAKARWRAAFIARDIRTVWISDEAPFADTIGPAHPAGGVVSTVLADLGRCFRAGGSNDEILARYAAGASPARLAIDEKLSELATFEGEQYMAAMSV
jgi:hypothetical protein